MLELVAIFFYLGLALIPLAALVLVILAWYRSREALRRLDRAEAQLHALRQEVQRLQGQAPAAPAPSAPAPAVPPAATTPVAPPAPVQPRPKPAPLPTASDLWREALPMPAPAVAPPAPAAPPVPSATPSVPAREQGGLERWLGVRGAAVLGGIALAIAGFLFVQYSIENGLLGPRARLILGAVLGLSAWVGSELLLRRGYVLLANAIFAGASVALFAVAWAADVLYGLIPLPASFGAMCAVTAISAWVALRRGSLLIAALGLVGGFATPLVLSRGGNTPIQLFGYVLLLDLGFLFVASKRRWPSIAALTVLGTTLMQGLWIFLRAEPGQGGIALVVLGLFALLFAVWGVARADAAQRSWAFSLGGALLLPFAFASVFAYDARFGPALWPMALLALLLCTAAQIVCARGGLNALPIGAASGALALLFSWIVGRELSLSPSEAWQACAAIAALACVQGLGLEWAARSKVEARRDATRVGLVVFCLPALLFWALSTTFGFGLSIYPVALAVLCLELWMLRRLVHGGLAVWSGLGLGLGGVVFLAWSLHHVNLSPLLWPDPWSLCAVFVGSIAVLCAGASRLREELRRPAAIALGWHGFMVAWACALPHWRIQQAPLWSISTWLLCLALPLLLALRARSIAAQLPLGLAGLCSVFALSDALHADQVLELAWLGSGGLLLAALPLLYRDAGIVAQRLGALVLVGVVFATQKFFAPSFHTSADWLAFAIWTVLSGGVWVAARARLAGHAAQPWLAATLFWLAAALGHADSQWPWASALLFACLLWASAWAKFQHSPFAWAATAAASLGLVVALGAHLDGALHAERTLWNAHLWYLLLPALCTSVAALQLRAHPSRWPVMVSGVASIVLGFLWLNVEIIDAYAFEPVRVLDLDRLPQRDLLLSLAWGVYALFLLGLGVRWRISAARWGSLALILLTIVKVFLLDLDRLEGLWRATSMLGLAVSLLIVSFLYQRFVFQKDSGKS